LQGLKIQAFKVLKYPFVPITFGVDTFPVVHVFVVMFVKLAFVAERLTVLTDDADILVFRFTVATIVLSPVNGR